MRFLTPDAEARLDRVRSGGQRSLLCLDFDGVLAPIVADPEQAVIHPDAHRTLEQLAGRFATIAVVTGRPASQAVELGALRALAARLQGTGTTLTVRGQYGAQRWSSTNDRIESAPAPAGLAEFDRRLPAILAAAEARDAFVEHKGIAIAVHTRRTPHPAETLARVLPLVEESAAECGLRVEPGRFVLEVRGSGTDKGDALRELRAELVPTAVTYIGDDLGDIPAFQAVSAMRDDGLPGLLVCSASEEETTLLDLADVSVDGPDGVMEFLTGTWGPTR